MLEQSLSACHLPDQAPWRLPILSAPWGYSQLQVVTWELVRQSILSFALADPGGPGWRTEFWELLLQPPFTTDGPWTVQGLWTVDQPWRGRRELVGVGKGSAVSKKHAIVYFASLASLSRTDWFCMGRGHRPDRSWGEWPFPEE